MRQSPYPIRLHTQLGCGVGNTIYPLLELNPRLTVYACDFSATAVKLVHSHPQHASGRVVAFVADITKAEQLAAHVPAGGIDCCTAVFVLSALAPEQMPQVCCAAGALVGARLA